MITCLKWIWLLSLVLIYSCSNTSRIKTGFWLCHYSKLLSVWECLPWEQWEATVSWEVEMLYGHHSHHPGLTLLSLLCVKYPAPSRGKQWAYGITGKLNWCGVMQRFRENTVMLLFEKVSMSNQEVVGKCSPGLAKLD